MAKEWTPHKFIPSRLAMVGNVMEDGPDSPPAFNPGLPDDEHQAKKEKLARQPAAKASAE